MIDWSLDTKISHFQLSQFSGLVDFCDFAANSGIVVVVAALSGDFERRAMGEVTRLVPICEEVTTLKSICMSCYKDDASFSYRINVDNKEVIYNVPLGNKSSASDPI